MRQRLSKLNKEYDEGSAVVRQKLQPQIAKLTDQLKEAEGATGRNQRNVGNYGDAMNALPGPIGQAKMAVQTFGAAMKTALGPIVLIIGAITGLVKAMMRSEEGANRVKRVMAILQGAFGAILDVITNFGIKIFDAFENPKEAVNSLWETIKTNFLNRLQAIPAIVTSLGKVIGSAFKLDFDQAKKEAGELGRAFIQLNTGLDTEQQKRFAKGLKDLGNEIVKDANNSVRLAKAREELLIKEREWQKEQVKLRNEIENARAAVDDRKRTFRRKNKAK